METTRHLDLLAGLFRQHGLSVAGVSRLSDGGVADADLVLWPYAVREDEAMRNAAPPARDGRGDRHSVANRQHTHLLVLPRDVPTFDQARQRVMETPVLGTGERPTHVQLEPLALADLAALFMAAGAPLRLALAVVVR